MDCSKTINFLHELKRLCDSRTVCGADADDKERCPMFEYCKDASIRTCAEDAITAIETVQKWSDEHPQKTYSQDFFEKFPKAQSYQNGTPRVCRKELYGRECPRIEYCDHTRDCKSCWNETVEE